MKTPDIIIKSVEVTLLAKSHLRNLATEALIEFENIKIYMLKKIRDLTFHVNNQTPEKVRISSHEKVYGNSDNKDKEHM